ncbi:hypothetical protein SMB34_21705 [Thalassospira permensis NBRC 106175]|uniref:Uncharacterized protein n=1 Tax=Thalassospira permensis NBRC 106175 TaxID=1353532 RepID=A0ABR4TJ81_9PROT|nr:hypothetical protein SMB34_21705 [Thalassospira permensis NBRC 106175]
MGPLVIGQDGRGAPCWQGSRRNCDRQRLAATGRIGQQVANSGGRWVFDRNKLVGMGRLVRGDWCDGPESVGCLDFRVRQTGDIRRGSQRGKVWRNHASEAAWEDHGRLRFIGWREVAKRPEG